QRMTGLGHDALPKIAGGRGGYRGYARWQAGLAYHWHRPVDRHLFAKTDGAHIRHVVADNSLLFQHPRGAAGGRVDNAIHLNVSLAHGDQGLHDLILRLDRLRVGLIRTLRNDQIDQLQAQNDVGLFYSLADYRRKTVFTRPTDKWLT